MKYNQKSFRHRAAVVVSYNWRIRNRLPHITKLAVELKLISDPSDCSDTLNVDEMLSLLGIDCTAS